MAAPTYVNASTGSLDISGSWTHTGMAPGASGRIIILQVIQDAYNANITLTSVTNMNTLAGGASNMTSIGQFNLGASVAKQHLWIGRSTSTSAPVASGGNTAGDDIIVRMYQFQDVNTGSNLSDVIENATAGGTDTKTGTSTGISAPTVATLDVDRLAVCFVGVNDDNAVGAFTGMTGGTWGEAVAEYLESASTTDMCMQLQTAAMAQSGSISGGSYTMAASDAWGATGFALIGTTAATPVYQKLGMTVAMPPMLPPSRDSY